MRIAIFLFLVLMNCSTLFAYEVNVTKLTDEKFDPLPKEINILCIGLEVYDKEKGQELVYKQIATITLVFGVNEIGQDNDAVDELAKKEAAKLGADMIVYISGKVYKNSEEISSMTYRCVRTNYCDNDVEILLKEKDLLKSTVFYNKLREVIKDYNILWREGSTEDEILFLIGVKRYKALKENNKITVFYDIKTNKQLDKDEICKRWIHSFTSEIIFVYKENLDLYISEYDKIMQVLSKYTPENGFDDIYFPKPDIKKNIDFENLKYSLFAEYEFLVNSFYELCLYRNMFLEDHR